MRRVILESPYAGDIENNIAYAKAALLDSLKRGEAPIASHLLWTQPGILDDGDRYQRRAGISAGLAWLTVADAMVVYTDNGVSVGVAQAIIAARQINLPVEFRSLNGTDNQNSPNISGTSGAV